MKSSLFCPRGKVSASLLLLGLDLVSGHLEPGNSNPSFMEVRFQPETHTRMCSNI